MGTRFVKLDEICKPMPEWPDRQLCIQRGYLRHPDGTKEPGCRFIKRNPDGSLQPARGQALFRSLDLIQELIDAARSKGWTCG